MSTFGSLLTALDPLSTRLVILFFIFVAFSTTLGVGVALTLVVLFELDDFFHLHVHIIAGHVSESFLGTFELLRAQFNRELDLEQDKEISGLVRLFVEGKTLIFNGFDLIGLDNLSWGILDAKFRSIKMVYYEINASDSLEQSNLLLHQKVGTLSLEDFMGHFLHYYDNIAGLLARVLVSLTMEGVMLAIR